MENKRAFRDRYVRHVRKNGVHVALGFCNDREIPRDALAGGSPLAIAEC